MKYLVTGGSRGLGRRLVLDLIAGGHSVAFTFLSDEAAAEEVQSEGRRLGPSVACYAIKLDQRDPAMVEDVCSQIIDKFGGVDVLVNNAGINRNGLAVAVTDEDWNEVLATNLSGPFYLSRHLLPCFIGQRRGRFIHMSSVAGNGATGQICYAASKAGLVGLSGTLAREYGSRGITSNVLVLGMFAGGMSVLDASEDNRKNWKSLCPVRREGDLGEVFGTVSYLASDAASYVNGQEIFLTGGMNWVS
ncbi:SDR family oxidoreductase [Methylobacterium sp. WL122]|nr:SDR family oxidoreductase [Methylobacterium sp. WL122]